ncbi:hypothetical protein ACP70R_007802 [Stipagrostis hirtigluma subsp. patula]
MDSDAASGGADRLSRLGDGALGHILSFLPAAEAARAAVLSRRWRHVFAAVHTFSFEEPGRPVRDIDDDDDDDRGYWSPGYYPDSKSAVDGWLSHAAYQAGGELHIDLRFGRRPVCYREYTVCPHGTEEKKDNGDGDDDQVSNADGSDKKSDEDGNDQEEEGSGEASDEDGDGQESDEDSDDQDSDEDGDGQEYDEDGDDQESDKVGDDQDSDEQSHGQEYDEDATAKNTMKTVTTYVDDQDSDEESHGQEYDEDGDDQESNEDGEDSDEDGDDQASDEDGDSQESDEDSDDQLSDEDGDYQLSDEDSDSDDEGEGDDPASRQIPPPESSPDSDGQPKEDEYVTPRSLFSCSVLRTLRLGTCWLDLPAAIALPCLDTLHLTRVTGPRGAVQRLVAACPLLAELTLEACPKLTALSVLGTRLHRLALLCCHDMATVAAGSPELRVFEYRGAVPAPPFLTTHGGAEHRITSCTLDFCGKEATDASELARLRDFLSLFAGAAHLHIKSARLGAGLAHNVFSSAPAFPTLRRLSLTGILPEDDDGVVSFTAVTRILERAPNLERLSLFFFPEPERPVDRNDEYYRERVREIPCSTPRTSFGTTGTREINLVHYQGAMSQRVLAKFLLRNAVVVDEVCCELAQGPLSIQTKLMEEIRGWTMSKTANMMFF